MDCLKIKLQLVVANWKAGYLVHHFYLKMITSIRETLDHWPLTALRRPPCVIDGSGISQQPGRLEMRVLDVNDVFPSDPRRWSLHLHQISFVTSDFCFISNPAIAIVISWFCDMFRNMHNLSLVVYPIFKGFCTLQVVKVRFLFTTLGNMTTCPPRFGNLINRN